ncbi:MAG: nuclear transport factor 2 family protein [Actinobacteria bacterium]|nr:nuclear transport factor 2 family protein [Actinomycetota bacterium]
MTAAAPSADDWHAVETLIMTYAERVDLGDFAGVAELFAHATYRAAAGDQVTSQRGAEAVLATFEGMVRRYDDGTPRTKHVTTNLMVDVDGDVANSRCYFTVFQQTDVLALQPIIAGRYFDRFERVDGDWRFADRLIHSDLIGDLSQHLLVDPFA